jgi:hypothetical protein
MATGLVHWPPTAATTERMDGEPTVTQTEVVGEGDLQSSRATQPLTRGWRPARSAAVRLVE